MGKARLIPPEPPDKAKRTDRADKLGKRKTHQETVVKTCLLKYLCGKGWQKELIQDAITQRVIAYSKRINIASLALLEILKECFEDKAISSVQLPDFTDQTFIRQLLLGTENARKVHPHVLEYQQRHPDMFQTIERYPGDRNIYSAGATKYITNLKNSLWMNFDMRVRTFTRRFQQVEELSDNERIVMMYRIMGWDMADLDIGMVFPMREIVYEAIKQHRKIIGEGVRVDKAWIENANNINTMLQYNVLLNRYYQENDLPLFNIVPVCKVRRHFITIDTSCLHGLMTDLELVKCNLETFMALRDDQWKSFLHTNRLQSSKNTFTGTIETDGVSICTHFTKPKEEKTGKTSKFKYDSKTQRVVGFDTGRSNICCAAEELDDEKIRSFNLTRKQFYQESGIISARKTTETWNKTLKTELVAMSKVSSKGMNLEKHQEYMNAFFKHYDALWNEYTKERWSRQRMRLYGGKKRALDRFFNTIKNADKTREVIIAYGSAKFAPGGKGEVSVPTTGFYKANTKHFKTEVTCEFRTTRVFYKDDSILEYIGTRRKPSHGVRGLLWCGSTNNNQFVHRDLNAALNIRRCLTSPIRPLSLTRRTGLRKLSKRIGKIVKW
jgi:hypothetical protein